MQNFKKKKKHEVPLIIKKHPVKGMCSFKKKKNITT